jgi:ABC-type uncharacterized transport system
MSALPLFWGEGGPHAILQGDDQRAPLIRQLSVAHTLTPLDWLDAESLAGIGTLLLAQPRGLSPDELAALDAWVRGGGRVLVFADPLLVWPSDFGLGDRRRAPPVTLLDPLLGHWGLTLESPEGNAPAPATITVDGKAARGLGVGIWSTRSPGCTVAPDTHWAECRIGKGRAVLVGDADMLDLDAAPDNMPAIEALLARLARPL